ncbi:MAG: glycosyltransferase family 4 protein [Patescibacteria group bacterium]
MTKRVIIFSTTYFPLVGGAEVAMKEVTDRLPGWQFDLFCARLKKGLPSTEKIGNVTVHRVGFGHSVDKYLLPILGPVSSLTVHRSPFIAHRSPPVIWSLMASYGGFAALVYTWLRPKTKLLLTLQEGDPLEHYAKRAGRFEFLHKMIFKRADSVQAISNFLAEWAVKMGFRGKPEVIPNGVDMEKFTCRISAEERQKLRDRWKVRDQDVVLITASRLSLKNGVDDLVRSLVHLPLNYKVVIAGEGEDREKLSNLVEELKLEDRVIFLGKKSHDELPGILQASEIFVRASISEGLGNSFLEAMAAGIPIIGTPVGGIPDFLIDGETGVFCKPHDPESIAMAVLRIQEEPGLREKLVINGNDLVSREYEWIGIAGRVEKLLNTLIG